jgi:hypothetical protein
LPGGGASVPAPTPVGITKRDDAGVGGSDRITLVWGDGVIRNTWLQLTVNATAATALSRPETFFFGNLVGETGDGATTLAVNARDLLATRRNLFSNGVPLTNRWDFNRDRRVSVADFMVLRRNMSASLSPVPMALVSSPRDDRRSAATSLLAE